MKNRHFLFGIVALLCSAPVATAQQVQTIPADTAVRIGKLDNGMTYYLRHNAKPAGSAEFHIVHNVGAIQEEDSQQGLAHFLEHMAFNGTKNLPGKQLIDYLESVGVKFGTNLNASTGVEMTTYMMSRVPLKREGIIDSALLILHDWSHFIDLEERQVDKERGVIIEELRQGKNANTRIRDKYMPVLFNENRYSYRNVIGEEERLRTFPHRELIDFYHRWYHPGLQAIVIVGDFNVDMMETKLRRMMADIPAADNPEPKQYFPIADNDRPQVVIATDPELAGSGATLYIKRPAADKHLNSSVQHHYQNLALSAAISLLNQRLSEIVQQPDAPFLGARAGNGAMSVTNDAITGSVGARNGEIPQAFEALYTEFEKARRYGFNEAELKRFKVNMMTGAEQSYLKRDDRLSGAFVNTYIQNFVNNTPVPSAEDRWKLDSTMIVSLKLADVNAIFARMMTHANNVLIVTAPEKADVQVPTSEEMLVIMDKVKNARIENYQYDAIDEPLISTAIKPGKVKKSQSGKWESTVWTLSNGVRVILKPTDLKKEEVIMSSYADGGLSTVSDRDYFSASLLANIIGESGVGKFSTNDLRKVLAGKSVTAGFSFGRFSTGIGGNSSRSDIETMLQLTYLYFTEPRFSRDDFDRFMDKFKNQLGNTQNTPNFKLQEQINRTIYGDNPRARLLTFERLPEVEFARINPVYDRFFKGMADDYTFYFVGDFDLDQIRPLVEKYLGGLPVNRNKLHSKHDGLQIRKGRITNRFETEMQTPKTTVLFLFSGDIKLTQQNSMTMSFLQSCLESRYLESIREDKGGTYGVSVKSSISRQPEENYTLQVSFSTDPALVDELLDIVTDEIHKIAENGPLADDLAKAREYRVKSRPESLKQNQTWLGYLQNYYTWNDDFHTDYDAILQSVDGAKVQALARKILEDGNLIEIIMNPTGVSTVSGGAACTVPVENE